MSQQYENPLTGYMMGAVLVMVSLMVILASHQLTIEKQKKIIASLEIGTTECEKKLGTETKRRTRKYERAHR